MMYSCSGLGLEALLCELAASSSSSSLSVAVMAERKRWRTISPNCGVEVTTTRCCAFSPIVASFAGKIMTTVMMPGSSRVRMRNERVRTRSRYSRLMISQRLRIRFTHSRFAYSIDEDFFERRFHQLELAEPCARGRELQQFL